MSNVCDDSTSYLGRPIGEHGGEAMYFWSFCFSAELSFLNCENMCIVNMQFELPRFIFKSVYVDRRYNMILSLSLLDLCACVYSCGRQWSFCGVVFVPYVVVTVTMHIICIHRYPNGQDCCNFIYN